MATCVPITLAGGLKAPAFLPDLASDPAAPSARPSLVPRSVPPHPSTIVLAFGALSDRVAEAARAEARLMEDASWDPAHALITEDDLKALPAAIQAAEALLQIPGRRISDGPMLRTARMILRILQLQTPEERAEARLVLADPRTMFRLAGTQRMGRGVAVMIGTALHHLDTLLAVGSAEALGLHDMSTDGGAAAPGDAVQEVQAF